MLKRLAMFLSIIASALLLVACGGTTDNTAVSDDNTAQNNQTEPDFTVTISGETENSIKANGRLACSEEDVSLGGLPYLSLTAGSFSGNNIEIRVPYNIESGTYSLVGQNGVSVDNPNYDLSPGADTGKIQYADADGNDWHFGEGSITLEAVPTTDGEPITGSFTATLTSEDTEGSLTVEGEFDYTATTSAFTDSNDSFTEAPCD